MTFLSPLALALAVAAAIPLLIHLWRRRIGTRIDFPAVRYLARAEREHSRQLRLRNLLLMLLRLAIVLLIAAAAARPVGRVGGGHAPTAIAVVLDNSLSTSAIAAGRPVLAALAEVARTTISRATPSDRVWLITADGRVAGGSGATLLADLARVTPLAGRGDLAAALAVAGRVVAGAGLVERQIVVVTDGQSTTWRPIAPLRTDARVLIHAPAGEPPPNRAVLAANAVPVRWTPRGAVTARIATAGDSVSWRVTLAARAARTLARGAAVAAAGSVADISVAATPAERGWVAGTVEIEPDELRADDVRYFALWIGAAPTVHADPAGGPFVASAVAALVDAGRAAPGPGVAIVPADVATRLPALIVAPADPVRLGAANRLLARLGVPWRFGAAITGGETPVRDDRLDGVTVVRRYALVRQGTARTDTLARAGGAPWIVGGDGWVLIASPLDPSATTLPVRAPFVPWLGDVLGQRLAGAAGGTIEAAPSATVGRPAWASALDDGGAAPAPLTGPTILAPSRAGTFFLLDGDRRAGALVVNAEPDESDLARLDDASLASRVRGGARRVVRDPARVADEAFAASGRRPLAVPMLAAVLLLLTTEAVVTRTRRER